MQSCSSYLLIRQRLKAENRCQTRRTELNQELRDVALVMLCLAGLSILQVGRPQFIKACLQIIEPARP
jgi:hypothetical protein